MSGAVVGRAWSTAEDAALRAAYATGSTAAARAALPGRSEVSIWKRAHRLGIASSRQWTQAEDDRLRWLWGGTRTLGELAHKLGRTPQACHHRAGVIGLRRRGFHGSESVEAASRRAGFSRLLLLKILDAAGVPIHKAFARPGLSRGLRRQVYVDPHDVDAAVRQWMAA